MKKWNILKHMLLSLVVAIIINYLWGFVTFREASSIGIIGGADGPTAIFIAGKTPIDAQGILLGITLLQAFLPGILTFLAMMLLYIPLKKWIESRVN